MTTTTAETLKILEEASGKSITLGNCLWAYRMSEEWTQVYMAKKLGISRQQLCDIEHGRRIPSPKLAERFAQKLGDSPEYFVRLALEDVLKESKMNFGVVVYSKDASQAGQRKLKARDSSCQTVKGKAVKTLSSGKVSRTIDASTLSSKKASTSKTISSLSGSLTTRLKMQRG